VCLHKAEALEVLAVEVLEARVVEVREVLEVEASAVVVLEVQAGVLQGQVPMHHQELEQESVLGQPQELASAQVREAQDLRLAHLLAQEVVRGQVWESANLLKQRTLQELVWLSN
jgi:hypothetical protein